VLTIRASQRPLATHRTMTKLIEDYGLIGDCETAALVSRAGSVDWLCWPRFDSGAVFAALLGGADNGHWSIAPSDPAPRLHRRYRSHTLILETTFEAADGSVTLIDFMPLREHGTSHLVRIVRGRRGLVRMTTPVGPVEDTSHPAGNFIRGSTFVPAFTAFLERFDWRSARARISGIQTLSAGDTFRPGEPSAVLRTQCGSAKRAS